MKTTALFLLSLAVGGLLMDQTAAQKLVATRSNAVQTYKAMPTTYGNLDAQIADTLYQLTRARLERVMRFNAKVPGTISADDVGIIKGELKAMTTIGIESPPSRRKTRNYFPTPMSR
jgi:hypothetical protein